MSQAAVLPMPDGRVHLAVLSNSALACFRRCMREFKYRYKMLRRPRRSSEALRFGSFFHVGLNAWWATSGDPAAKLEAAIDAMQARAEERPEDADPFELVKAEELMLGYTARWGDEGFDTVAVEQAFDVPLLNPKTGRESRTYRVQGKIDVIARQCGRLRVVEHKTTSEDIGAGSDYWIRISATDSQVSTYITGARVAGYEVDDCLYDVVRKVGLKPKEATPVEKRTYTKEKSKQCPFCKKAGNIPGPHLVGTDEDGAEQFCVEGRIITEPGGRLHAGQRETDETPEEFRERVREDIASKPEKYYARGPIVRLEHDEREHAGDVWQTAQFIMQAENEDRFPRSPNACERYHRFCDYFEVCSGRASIDDDNRFRTATTPHEELAEV